LEEHAASIVNMTVLVWLAAEVLRKIFYQLQQIVPGNLANHSQ